MTGRRSLVYLQQDAFNDTLADNDRIQLDVECCAVCRTDAKMWDKGHRDLSLPRVPGHELVGHDPLTRKRYIVWPGQVCGNCHYCLEGRENLCEEMRILGFHSDGGFASQVRVDRAFLVEVPSDIDAAILTFSEPVGCLLNGLGKVSVEETDKVLLYGGGLLGMLAALLLGEMGCRIVVVENSQKKLARLQAFCRENNIELCKETHEADFDLSINCCDSHIAFAQIINRLRKGGKLVYFSGLAKNEELDTGLLNLIHYKELEIYGSYGPGARDMQGGADFCVRNSEKLHPLIEKIISPDQVQDALPHILSGQALKYIFAFRYNSAGSHSQPDAIAVDNNRRNSSERHTPARRKPDETRSQADQPDWLIELRSLIQPLSAEFRDKAQEKVDKKTKPLGALGRIEDLAVQLATLQKALIPAVDQRKLLVFAGDHGVVEEGVSAFPAKVTVQMLKNFLKGGAAINAFCHQYEIDLAIVDMGVKDDLVAHPLLINQKVANGTANFTLQPAMNRNQALLAIKGGVEAFHQSDPAGNCSLLGVGEMGIGNTTSATAIICAVTGLSPVEVVGRGTGVDDRGLQRKREVVERALALHRNDLLKPSSSHNRNDGLALLQAVGGFELGGGLWRNSGSCISGGTCRTRRHHFHRCGLNCLLHRTGSRSLLGCRS